MIGISGIEGLIPLISKLQDIFNTVGTEAIQLPQIVVLGSQSSGKSSVIENIVGQSFLPRGTGIVTRCPLVLQLQQCNPKDDEYALAKLHDWGEFRHKEGEPFDEFSKICAEIKAETDRMAGNNKGICHKPIQLKIYSTRVINLSLVDLPGITKVPVGDQPADIENQVKELVMKYITNPNSIILAVTAANTDLATSEALKMAREVDPEGKRTLAVITKLDLMDKGTDAVDILNGNIIPVKLGIIGVVNRCQQDTVDNKEIEHQLKDEAEFLQKNYPAIASQNGTQRLRVQLNHILKNHIYECLPALENRIEEKTIEFQSLVSKYGEEVLDKKQKILELVTKFVNAYCSTVDGTADRARSDALRGGAQICFIFHEVFAQDMAAIDPLAGVTDMEILDEIRHANGPQPALFLPEGAFSRLVKDRIKLFEKPAIKCVHLVDTELQKTINDCGKEMKEEMVRFPKLKRKIADIVSKILHKQQQDAISLVKTLLEMELIYINTKHPDFVKNLTEKSENENENPGNGHSQPRAPKRESLSFNYKNDKHTRRMATKEEQDDCVLMKNCIENYFNIVRKSFQDSVPKAIMLTLSNVLKKQLQTELIKQLYCSSVADELLVEAVDVSVKRKEASAMLEALTRAKDTLNEIREK